MHRYAKEARLFFQPEGLEWCPADLSKPKSKGDDDFKTTC